MTPEHIQAALEATCDALLALQVVRARAGARAEADVEPELSQAIDAVREAIGELRSACPGDASVMTLGFVVGARRRIKRSRHKSSVEPMPDGIDRGLDTTR